MPQMIATRDSSLIEAYGYNSLGRFLDVQFKPSKSRRKGATWRYREVPPDVYAAFCRADSMGSFYLRHIKGAYPEQCVG